MNRTHLFTRPLHLDVGVAPISPAVNVGCRCLAVSRFWLCGSIPRSGIFPSYNHSTSVSLRTLHTVSHTSCPVFHSQQHRSRGTFAVPPCGFSCVFLIKKCDEHQSLLSAATVCSTLSVYLFICSKTIAYLCCFLWLSFLLPPVVLISFFSV